MDFSLINNSQLFTWLIKSDNKKVAIEKFREALIFLLIVFVFGKRISGLL